MAHNPSNTERQFEKTLSELAYTSLQDRAPGLLDYLVGFQVLDVNDDQTQAVGVFGAKVGEEYVYIPVWFMNGELKDGLMYLKNSDLFVPETESWVSYVLNRKPFKLGESSDITKSDLAKSGPDLLRLRNTPRLFGKASSARERSAPTSYVRNVPVWNTEIIQPWAVPCEQALTQPRHKLYKAAQARLDVVNFLKSNSAALSKAFIDAMIKSSGVAHSVMKFYSQEKLAELKKPRTVFQKKAEESGVHVIEGIKQWEGNGFEFTDKDRKRLMAGEVVIKDHRANTSKVYNACTRTRIQTPNESGVYDILLEDASIETCLVLRAPIKLNSYSSTCCAPSYPRYGSTPAQNSTEFLVLPLEGKGYQKVTGDQLYGKPTTGQWLGFKHFFDSKTKPLSTIKEGSCYVILTSNGTSTEPFAVTDKVDSEDGVTTLFISVYLEDAFRKKNKGPTYVGSGDYKIILRPDAAGSSILPVNNTAFVPSSARCVEVEIGTRSDPGSDYVYRDYSKEMRKPAPINTVENLLWRVNDNYSMIRIMSNGTEYQINVGSGDNAVKSAGMITGPVAFKQLTDIYGIHGETAHNMIKAADVESTRANAAKFFVQFAEGYPRLVKKASPYLTEEQISAILPQLNTSAGSDLGIGAPVEAPVMGNQAQTQLQPNIGNINQYNPNPQLDTDNYKKIQDAANSGQKDVFDTAVIGNLVKTTDSERLINKYLGDLILGVDRIGRILFLFIQHNEDFKNLYGQEDLIELEDNLKNNFKNLGELVIALKQKTVKDSPLGDRNDPSDKKDDK